MRGIHKCAIVVALGYLMALGVSAQIPEHTEEHRSELRNPFNDQSGKARSQRSVNGGEKVSVRAAFLVVLNLSAAPSSHSLVSNYVNELAQQQAALIELIQHLDAQAVILGASDGFNAGVMVETTPEVVVKLKTHALVKNVFPLHSDKPQGVDSAVAIKAANVVSQGIASGAGVQVAILDTGIDYTHALLGGVGTVSAYNAANVATVPVWPQGYVLGGKSYAVNLFNPIDPSTDGHGTAVASAVAAAAPDARYHAYRVCDSTCSGEAQIRALEHLDDDPNITVVNMSLGSDMGASIRAVSGTQGAIHNLVKYNDVSVVVSAGNAGDFPFMVGAPSTTPNALSVAALTHPTQLVQVVGRNTLAETIKFADFNPSVSYTFDEVSTPLVYEAVNVEACNPFTGDLTGKGVLVIRGNCSFVVKVKHAQDAGAKFVVVYNSANEIGAVSMGGDDPQIIIPSVAITHARGLEIKDAIDAQTLVYALEVQVFDGAKGVATFSSRGPSLEGLLKPEITAPGTAIQLAKVGTGTQLAPISGTSFSGPLVAGTVALMREALPNLTALEIKAALMNTADLNVYVVPESFANGELAPISAIGAGQVNVEKAIQTPAIAWVDDRVYDTQQAALSYGLLPISAVTTLTKQVHVKNISSRPIRYQLRLEERFASDRDTQALAWQFPETIDVPAASSVTFDVQLTIDPTRLPTDQLANTLQSHYKAAYLTTIEYDGALVFDDLSTADDHDLHLVYHVIPRPTTQFSVNNRLEAGESLFTVTNTGLIDADVSARNLTAFSRGVASSPLDIRSVSINVDDIDTAICSSGYTLSATLGLASAFLHSIDTSIQIDLDADGNGVFQGTTDRSMFSRTSLGLAGFTERDYMVSLTSDFDGALKAVGNVYHNAGQRHITLEHCLEHVNVSINGRLLTRTSVNQNRMSYSYLWAATNQADIVEATMPLVLAPDVSFIDEDSGLAVTELAPGATAKLQFNSPPQGGVMIRSIRGDLSVPVMLPVGNTSSAVKPVLPANMLFRIDEHSAANTLIGHIVVPAVPTASPLQSFSLVGSSSAAVTLDSDGRIWVADADLLDYDIAPVITLIVQATNQANLVSDETVVQVHLNSLASSSSSVSSGSLSSSSLSSASAAASSVSSMVSSVQSSSEASSSAVTSSSSMGTELSSSSVGSSSLISSSVSSSAASSAVAQSSIASSTVSSAVNISSASSSVVSSSASAAPKKSGGGAINGWLLLLLLPLWGMRRRMGA